MVNPHRIALWPAIMWQDTRASTVCADLTAYRELVYHRTGVRVLPVFSAPKIKWLRDSEPDTVNASKYVGIQDLVLSKLTGRLVTDRSFAGTTNLYNLERGDWDNELIELFGVDRFQPVKIIDSGSVVGEITHKIVHETECDAHSESRTWMRTDCG